MRLEVSFEVRFEGVDGERESGIINFTHTQTKALLRARGLGVAEELQLVRDLVKEAVCCALTEASCKEEHVNTEDRDSVPGIQRPRR